MRLDHRVILVDRVDSSEIDLRYGGKAVNLSNLDNTFYDLKMNMGIYSRIYLTSKSVAEMGEILSEVKESGVVFGKVYVCQSKNIFAGVINDN